MTTTSLSDLGDQRFVSLTTYRRTGAAVSTPVWIAHDPERAGALLVITPTASGKVKRLRRDDRVELRPCDRRGRVAEGAPAVAGRAEIRDGAAEVDRVRAVMGAKYRLEYRLFMVVEALVRRNRHTDRVGLVITSREH